MDDLIILTIYSAPLFILLAVGGFIADYIFPHIKPLQRWIDTLPMQDDESEEVPMSKMSPQAAIRILAQAKVYPEPGNVNQVNYDRARRLAIAALKEKASREELKKWLKK